MSSNNTKIIIFALQTYGRLTEWLGSGLQNRLRRFESATDLNQSLARSAGDFLFSAYFLKDLSLCSILCIGERNNYVVEGSCGSYRRYINPD